MVPVLAKMSIIIKSRQKTAVIMGNYEKHGTTGKRTLGFAEIKNTVFSQNEQNYITFLFYSILRTKEKRDPVRNVLMVRRRECYV